MFSEIRRASNLGYNRFRKCFYSFCNNSSFALTSATTTMASGQTAANLIISNNNIVTVSRGISINGAATTVAPSLVISNNLIGNPTKGALNQVYIAGITVSGSDNASITANTIYVGKFP
ncbi:MAG: hypothetical protein R3A12_07075 [Ignavibacteria bacterium]